MGKDPQFSDVDEIKATPCCLYFINRSDDDNIFYWNRLSDFSVV